MCINGNKPSENMEYITKTEGIGGTIKYYYEDFNVSEISYFNSNSNGKYLIAELEKKNWDLNHCIKIISNKLNISYKRIGFAGTKDKRAVTRQKISIYNINKEQLESISIKDIHLKYLGYSNKKIEIGDLIKNKFEINIRFLKYNKQKTKLLIENITNEIISIGGVPNYYGIQRFGDKREITHLIGYYILKRDYKQAVLTYLTSISCEEDEDTKKMRKYILKEMNFKEALKICPLYLSPERTLLDSLIKNNNNYLDSILNFPNNLFMMFIHSYQSQIFNCIISERLKRNLKLNEAIIGDIVCYQTKEKTPKISSIEKVTIDNIDGINNLIKKKRAYITAPLIGYDTIIASGIPGEIEKTIFEKTKLNISDFNFENEKNKNIHKFSSRGTRKEILLVVEPTFSIVGDDNNFFVNMKFELPKGSYATTILREYIK